MNLQHPGQISRVLTDGKYHDLLYFVGALAYDERNDGMWIGTNAGLFFYDLKRKQLEITVSHRQLIKIAEHGQIRLFVRVHRRTSASL